MSFTCYMLCSFPIWVLSQHKWGLRVGYVAGVITGVNRCTGFDDLCRYGHIWFKES